MIRRLLLLTLTLAVPVSATAQSETVEYYATDQLGSVRVVFDANGAILARMDYKPFGQDLSGASGLPANRFANLFRDGEADLDYAQARSYQARTGRFNAPDPVYAGLFDPQGWNRYAYALNNPLTYVDPTGLTPCRKYTWDKETQTWHCDSYYADNSNAANDTIIVFIITPVFRVGTGLPEGAGGAFGAGTTGTTTSIITPQPSTTTTTTTTTTNTNPNATKPPEEEPNKWSCLKSNYGFAWTSTNRFFLQGPTRLARTGVGLITGGAVARSAALTSPLMLLKDLVKGEATAIMGARAVATSVGVSVVTNAVISGAVLEVGITFGSGIDAAYQTFVAHKCQ